MWRVIARRAASIWRAVTALGLVRLHTERAEMQLGAGLGQAVHASLVRLAVLGSVGLHHGRLPGLPRAAMRISA